MSRRRETDDGSGRECTTKNGNPTQRCREFIGIDWHFRVLLAAYNAVLILVFETMGEQEGEIVVFTTY